ncbi:MAG TPA: hypothetical protein VKS01_09770, partial [Bryobacteraceae bacterium]|nr:hypothetical protein [Bryobacteraceae bacterium]
DALVGTRDLLAKAGDTEASFFADLGAFLMKDFGVDENQFLSRIFADGEIDDGDAPGDSDLRGSEADALGGVTGFEHIVDELVQFRRIEFLDGFGLFLEYGLPV